MNELNYIEIDNTSLENTPFFKAYSKLGFNHGYIFKRIGSAPPEALQQAITQLDTEIIEVEIANTGERIKLRANQQIHDFIFDLLTNPTIIEKDWTYIDDDKYSFIDPEYNSCEKFRTIGLHEIDSVGFSNTLLHIGWLGSAYFSLEKSQEEISQLADDFIKEVVDNNSRIIEATAPWGQFYIGLFFRAFFIFRKNDIILFAVDDYD